MLNTLSYTLCHRPPPPLSIHRAALWILGEYCTTVGDIAKVVTEIRTALGEVFSNTHTFTHTHTHTHTDTHTHTNTLSHTHTNKHNHTHTHTHKHTHTHTHKHTLTHTHKQTHSHTHTHTQTNTFTHSHTHTHTHSHTHTSCHLSLLSYSHYRFLLLTRSYVRQLAMKEGRSWKERERNLHLPRSWSRLTAHMLHKVPSRPHPSQRKIKCELK